MSRVWPDSSPFRYRSQNATVIAGTAATAGVEHESVNRAASEGQTCDADVSLVDQAGERAVGLGAAHLQDFVDHEAHVGRLIAYVTGSVFPLSGVVREWEGGRSYDVACC